MTRLTFEQAVVATPPLVFFRGLKALSRYSSRILAQDASCISGSVNLDKAYCNSQPNAAVWDYGVAYRKSFETVYWIEIHPADNSHLGGILDKAAWLMKWLSGEGSRFATFPRSLVWIASGRSALAAKDPKRRRLEKAGVRFVGKKLHIP